MLRRKRSSEMSRALVAFGRIPLCGIARTPGLLEWLCTLRPGDTLGVYAKASYPGWKNYVIRMAVDV